MRLPIKVATAIRSRKLIAPGARVLVALSGGPDSVALLLCLIELSRKRDLGISVAAAHLNHRLRGRAAVQDQIFCERLCRKLNVDFTTAHCEVARLAGVLKRSREDAGRLARRAFLAQAAQVRGCSVVATAHHADDRIETVLYRLCRGSGIAGLSGIGWSDALALSNAPDVSDWLRWEQGGKTVGAPFIPPLCKPPERIVRPLLGCRKTEIVAYLKQRKQRYCTDRSNFDTRIPRNAIRSLVLPVLESNVHSGVRAALWRLAEEAEVHAERTEWRRGWLEAIAALGSRGYLALPVPRLGSAPTPEELADVLNLLKTVWRVKNLEVNSKHLGLLRGLFGPSGAHRRIPLPGKVVAERREREVWIHR